MMTRKEIKSELLEKANDVIGYCRKLQGEAKCDGFANLAGMIASCRKSTKTLLDILQIEDMVDLDYAIFDAITK